MKQSDPYEFKFSGLKPGKHELDWAVAHDFFAEHETGDIESSDIKLFLYVEKQERLMNLDFVIEGRVQVICDRCGDLFWMNLHSENSLIARFSNETDFSDDKVIFLDSSEYKIDLSQFIYEFTVLELPLKRTHDEGECRQEVIDQLTDAEEQVDENDNIDPRWEALRKLQNQ